ncbi:fumarylacetoacetate hydrolase family protein [Nakamurella flava]|uniref:Fumarylacetoacetate hydrolase family protein n=1 Tax=Nakamurella flava TaxID=2576308 RepID=A0A4V6CSJ2_9ACTN|nr:fumarylacetoacetate hydrolase family protein [Nakamurella flava]TKV61775.1 fumarylacetoacetate hydrolase family protein [Nakamurella flava]
MRLATVTLPTGGTAAVRIDGPAAASGTAIPDVADVGALLDRPDWRAVAAAADGPTAPLDDLGRLIPRPGKVACVGLNYRAHIEEMGRPLPDHPTLFAKFADALIGPQDDIEIPSTAAEAVDWECELVVVVGATLRGADRAEAAAAIAGYTVMNDISMRDWQFRTREWLQGKTFGNTTPVGPVLVTADEWQPGPNISTEIDGELVQQASTGDLVFDPADLVAYLSQIVTLRPGDLIATGTPGGVGHARKPPRYLAPGMTVRTTIDGIGSLQNTCVAVDGRGRRAGTP